MEEYIYINGEFYTKENAKISVFDHGVLYGDGIFEGIRLYDEVIFKCKEHMDRLYDVAKAIMLDIPISKVEMAEVVAETCRKNKLTNGYIRLLVTRGDGDLSLNPLACSKPNIICIAGTIKLYTEEMYQNGVKVITAVQRRNKATILDPQIKSLNYLNNVLGKMEANRAGAGEAIMLDHDGIVAECTADNIFIIKDNVIYTPPIHVGILDGITRRTIMDIARQLNMEVYEKEFTLFNVYNADECFLTGSGAEIIAVSEADGRKISEGKEGAITKKLREEFKKITKSEGGIYYGNDNDTKNISKSS